MSVQAAAAARKAGARAHAPKRARRPLGSASGSSLTRARAEISIASEEARTIDLASWYGVPATSA
jgi:hypothetical protein